MQGSLIKQRPDIFALSGSSFKHKNKVLKAYLQPHPHNELQPHQAEARHLYLLWEFLKAEKDNINIALHHQPHTHVWQLHQAEAKHLKTLWELIQVQKTLVLNAYNHLQPHPHDE
jgi:hypothetical protein